MEYVFHVSAYDDPALDGETAELLRQRLEAYSRETVPGMWKVTDKLNARAAKGPGREARRKRTRIYGAFLIALGIFALVPGLMEPRIPSLVWAGSFAVFVGVLNICLVKEQKPLAPPESCRKEAAELLRKRRETDWNKIQTEVYFDGDGIMAAAGDIRRTTPYSELTGVFETERLWLLVFGGEKAMLLQKKDLVSGDRAEFLPALRRAIAI